MQQADVGELDGRPERLVELGLRIAVEQGLDRLLHPQVVHLDALAREFAHPRPGGALEQRAGPRGGVAEQAVVLVEAFENRAGNVPREVRAPLVNRDDLGARAHTAASFAFFLSSKNCSSSVEPRSAVVDAVPAVTTCVISSK